MKKFILSLALMYLPGVLISQMSIPLYSTTVPHNKSTIEVSEIVINRTNNISFVRQIIKPEIYVYLPKNVKNTGKAVIICPGGGYGGLAIDHEGHQIALKLNEHGIAGIVLKYRCPDTNIVTNKTIVPLQDVMRAMQITRSNAKKWKIKKIGIMGASAGGHLASTALTHYNMTLIDNPDNYNLRPDFGILNYPVISFADSITHRGSRDNLIRNNGTLDNELVKLYSNELQVNKQTPPVFITHAEDDKVVPITNSILFISACHQNNVPVQSYFYAHGGHGYGIKNPTAQHQWIESCIPWILKQ